MEAGVVAGGGLLHPLQGRIRAPLDVGRAEQQAHPLALVAPVRVVELGELGDVVLPGDGHSLKLGLQVLGQAAGEGRQELRIVLVHDLVLVAKGGEKATRIPDSS